MISGASLLNALQERGFRFYTGVPCSFLTPLINEVSNSASVDYVSAANEGGAVAIAAGAWLAGKQSVVMCQNSGLGNMINPLTSLNFPFRIPALLICTWRGQPGLKDEPQHELMGQVMHPLTALIRIPHRDFADEPDALDEALDHAVATMAESSLPFAFFMHKESLQSEELVQHEQAQHAPGFYADLTSGGSVHPTRIATLEHFLALVPEDVAVITTTGKTSRELFTLADRKQHFYLVGSMGYAGALGFGVALNTKCRVVVLDGDGAALMGLGACATIGAYGPRNLIHVVLDNGVYDSTGGQRTAPAAIDFARLAIACGYRHASACDDLNGWENAFKNSLIETGPHLIHVRLAPGSMANLGRPTVAPFEVARRFRDFLRCAEAS